MGDIAREFAHNSNKDIQIILDMILLGENNATPIEEPHTELPTMYHHTHDEDLKWADRENETGILCSPCSEMPDCLGRGFARRNKRLIILGPRDLYEPCDLGFTL